MANSATDVHVVAFVNVAFFFAFITLCLRLAVRKYRRQYFTTGDGLSAATILCLMMSWTSINLTMVFGINSQYSHILLAFITILTALSVDMTSEERTTTNFTPEEIWRRTKGSQFQLVLRFFYETLFVSLLPRNLS